VLTPAQVVLRNDSTTSVTSDLNPADFGATYTFTATVAPKSGSGVTPSGDVTFVDTSTGVTLGTRTLDNTGKAQLTVNGTTVSFLDAGLHSIQASYPGDTNYNPSTGSFTQTVNQVSTSTSLSVNSGSSVFGESRTYTATVTSSTTTPFGKVTFTADDGQGHVTAMGSNVALDSNGKAILDFNALPVGTQTVTAAFNANVDFKGSSGTTTETVTRAPRRPASPRPRVRPSSASRSPSRPRSAPTPPAPCRRPAVLPSSTPPPTPRWARAPWLPAAGASRRPC